MNISTVKKLAYLITLTLTVLSVLITYDRQLIHIPTDILITCLALFWGVCFQVIRKRIQSIIQKLFIKQPYQLDKLEASIARDIDRLLKKQDLDEILITIAHKIQDKLKLEFIDVLIPNQTQFDSKILSRPPLSKKNPLIKRIKNQKRILIEHQYKRPNLINTIIVTIGQTLDTLLSAVTNTKNTSLQKEAGLVVTKEKLAQIYIPFFSFSLIQTRRLKLDAVMLLGPKKSGDSFSDDELLFFANITFQIQFAMDRLLQIKDITHQRDIAQTQRQKAQAANIAKNQFLNMISHEIRTPLNGIQMTFDILLAQEVIQKLFIIDNELKTQRDLCEADFVRLARLLERVLQVQSLDKPPPILIQNIPPKEILNTLIWAGQIHLNLFNQKNKAVQLETKELEINLNINPENWDLTEEIDMDKKAVGEALFCFMENAINFTKSGKVNVISWRENTTWFIQINDTGIGIPEDKFDDIFECFYQVDQSSTREVQGAGVGLTAAKRNIDALNGKISVNSTLGQGSSFTIALPYIPSQPRLDEGKKLEDPNNYQWFLADKTIVYCETNYERINKFQNYITQMPNTRFITVNSFKELDTLIKNESIKIDILLVSDDITSQQSIKKDLKEIKHILQGQKHWIPQIMVMKHLDYTADSGRYRDGGFTETLPDNLKEATFLLALSIFIHWTHFHYFTSQTMPNLHHLICSIRKIT